MKYTIALFAVFLAACNDPIHSNDPEIVSKYFEQCMRLIPEGPKQVQNNDWDEVISECRWYAEKQAVQYQRVSKVNHGQ